MKRGLIVFLMMAGVVVFGCSDKKAKELFETAQLEELQNNSQHAMKLYEEILRSYPESDYARQARDRLVILGKSDPVREQ